MTKMRFKRAERFFLCFVLALLFVLPLQSAAAKKPLDKDDPLIVDLDRQIAESREKQKKIEEEMRNTAPSVKALESQVNELQAEIEAYNKKLDALNGQIGELDAEISSVTKSIALTEQRMAVQKEEIRQTQQLLGERIRAMYMAGNISKVEMILSADSFENLLSRVELVSRVTKHDNKIVKELRQKISALEKDKALLEEQKAKLQDSRQELSDKRNDLAKSRTELALRKLEVDRSFRKLDSYLKRLSADNSELIAYQRAAEQKKYNFMHGIDDGYQISQGDGRISGMIWPLPYSGTYITSGFGPRTLHGRPADHWGIDISMPGASNYNKTVVASQAGVVLKASNVCQHNYPKVYNCGCNGGFGNLVVIDHGNGVRSYYGHLTRATVYVGQHVARGQAIGIMGCTGHSTGAHLHFEMRIGSASYPQCCVNPLNYVSLPR